jgi:hypothetical protein
MRQILFYIFVCIGLSVTAQGFKVRHFMPSTNTSLTKAVFETTPGNYFAGGIVVDSASGNNRLCIAGLGNQGQLLWTKKYGTNSFIYLNNPFVSRTFYKKDNFVYYTTCVFDSTNKYIGVLVKFNFMGDIVWQKTYRDIDPLEDVVPQMLTSSQDGGFLITGYFQNNGSTPYSKCLIIKTDANGNELWRKKLGKTNPNVQDGKNIIQDSATKKIVLVGYQYLNAADSYDNVIITDSLGEQPQRMLYIGSQGLLLDLVQTFDKKIVAVGYKTYPSGVNWYNRSFAVKFDLSNPTIPIWKIDNYDRLTLANGFLAVVELPDHNLILSGGFDSLRILNQMQNDLIRLVKVRPNGSIISKRYYDYKTNSPNNVNYMGTRSINLTSDGGLIAAIECFNSPAPNPFFFVKFDSTGCDSSLSYCQSIKNTVGQADVAFNSSGINIFPNPAKTLVTVNLDVSMFAEPIDFLLSDLSGRIILNEKINQQSHTVDLKELAKGLYIVSLVKNNLVLFKGKIAKE